MYNFLNINPGDNPNEGRNKINYNFSLINGGSFTGGTSGGTPAGNTYEVQFNGGGVFSASTKFKFNPNDNTLVEGYNNSISGASNYSSIIGGKDSYINNSCSASIVGTEGGYISNNSRLSGIFGGVYNNIQNSSQAAGIFAGAYNSINYSDVSVNLGSLASCIGNSNVSSIIGGYASKISESTGSTLIGGVGFNNYYTNIQYGVSGGTVMSGSQTSVIIGGGYTKEFYSYPYTIRYNYPNRMYNSTSSAILVGHGNCVNDVKNSTIIGGTFAYALNSDKVSLINSENVVVSGNSKNVTIIGSGTKEIPTSGAPGAITFENSNNILMTNSAPIRSGNLYGDFFAPSVIKNVDGAILNGVLGSYIGGYTTGQTIGLDLQFILNGNIYNSQSVHAKNSTYFNVQNSVGITSIFGDNSYIYNNSVNNLILHSVYSTINYSCGNSIINSEKSYLNNSCVINQLGSIKGIITGSNYSSIINAGSNNTPTVGTPGFNKIYDSNGAMIIGGSEARVDNFYGTIFAPNEIHYSDNSLSLFSLGNIISGSSYGKSVGNISIGGGLNKIYDSKGIFLAQGQNNYVKLTNTTSFINSKDSCINDSGFSTLLNSQYSYLNNTSCGVIINGDYAGINNSRHSTIVGSVGSYINNYSYYSALLGGKGNKLYDQSSYSSIVGGCCNTLSNTSNYASIVGGKSNTLSGLSSNSSMIGGGDNKLYECSNNSSIVGGESNALFFKSNRSSILGGQSNLLSGASNNSSIVGGESNTLFCGSNKSSIIGGENNILSNFSRFSSIVGGKQNTLSGHSNYSSIVGGKQNELFDNSYNSSMIGGNKNKLSGHSCNSSMIGGKDNTLYIHSCNSSIVSGRYNKLYDHSCNSSIVGGYCNELFNHSKYSSIVGGYKNSLSGSLRSVIIGGQNLSLTSENDTVLVPILKVSTSISSLSGGTFYSGITGTYIVGANTFTIVNGIITDIV